MLKRLLSTFQLKVQGLGLTENLQPRSSSFHSNVVPVNDYSVVGALIRRQLYLN